MLQALFQFNMLQKGRKLLIMIMCLATTSACTGSGAHVVYLQFRPTGEIWPRKETTVGIAPFQDARSAPQIVGKRIRVDGSPETIMLGSPTTSQDITLIAARYLESKGVRVVDLGSWRPDPEGLKDLPRGVNIAVTGKIEALEISSDSTLFKTTTRYRVRLSATFGLPEKNEILTRSIEISPQKITMQFDVREVEEELNKAIVEALARLFETILPPI